MISGGNGDNRRNRRRVQQQVLDDGRCSVCHPHGGENYTRRDGKYVEGTWRPSKSKERK